MLRFPYLLHCFTLVGGLVCATSVAVGQDTRVCGSKDPQKNHGMPCLVASVKETLGQNQLTEYLYPLAKLSRSINPSLVMRICSSDELSLSIPRAALYLPDLINQLRFLYGQKGLPRIFVARSGQCENGMDPFLTEVWAISSISDMPPSEEIRDSSELDLQRLNFELSGCAMSSYLQAISTVKRKAAKDASARIILIGYFVNAPSVALRRRMKQAVSALTRSGIDKKRIASGFREYDGEPGRGCNDRRLDQPVVFYVAERQH